VSKRSVVVQVKHHDGSSGSDPHAPENSSRNHG
jgi:hypothetical protein